MYDVSMSTRARARARVCVCTSVFESTYMHVLNVCVYIYIRTYILQKYDMRIVRHMRTHVCCVSII